MTDEKKTIAVLTTINQPNNKVGDWFEITKIKQLWLVTTRRYKMDNDKCILLNSIKNQNLKLINYLKIITRVKILHIFCNKIRCSQIIDIDDDNFPIISEWENLLKSEFEIFEHAPSEKVSFKNIYSYFSNSDIPFWPRGFPLNLVNLDESKIKLNDIIETRKRCWSLAMHGHGDPDIDAIHA